MRGGRNMGRGRGRGRGGRQNNMPSDSFVSDHLRDIDLELELLKRKREIIEQQQSLYQPFKDQQKRNYNEQSYSYNENVGQGSSNRDFSYLYDDELQQNRNSFPKKRPFGNDWQQNTHPNKAARLHGYSGPSNQTQRSYGSISQPKKSYGNRPLQERRPIGQRISYKKPQTPVKSFIHKGNKAPVPLNTIVFQAIPEHNQIVTGKMQSEAKSETSEIFATPAQPERNSMVVTEQPVAETSILKKPEENEHLRLLPNKLPTKQMRGRLEMSLGAILSDVKEVYANSPYATVLGTLPLQRIIKQNIRNRIRTVMLGKIVESPKEIIKMYRDVNPRETDEDIINETIKIARLDKSEEPVNPEEINTSAYYLRPHDYYKENIIKLLTKHLTEMFSKVEDISEESFKSNVTPNQIGGTGNNEENSGNEFAEDVSITNDTFEPVKTDNDTTNNDIEGGDILNEESTSKCVTKSPSKDSKLQLNEYTYEMMLPRVFKRNIPAILKMLQSNKAYKKDVAELAAATISKYVEYSKERDRIANELKSGVCPDFPSLSTLSVTKESAEAKPLVDTAKKQSYPYHYYIKLMGKPHLPKRKLMQPFLEQFEPKSIKKHRTIHNLLFIGFTDKKNFDAILKTNGTFIGKSTLSIRVCEKPNEKQGNTTGTVEDKDNRNTDDTKQRSDEQNVSNTDNTTENMVTQSDIQDTSKTEVHEESNDSNNSVSDNIEKEERKEEVNNEDNEIINPEIMQETNNDHSEVQMLNTEVEFQPQDGTEESIMNNVNLDDEEHQSVQLISVQEKSAENVDST